MKGLEPALLAYIENVDNKQSGLLEVCRLTFIVVSANVLKSLSDIAFFITSILLGTHTSGLNCKKRGMKTSSRTLQKHAWTLLG